MSELRHIRGNSEEGEYPGNVSNSGSNGPALSLPNGLTGIHGSIHWPATPTDVGAASEHDPHDEHNEFDRIAIEHFLDTLARIAISIAARENRAEAQDQDGKR